MNKKLLRCALDLLVDDCRPRKIILFGSYARGTAKEDSDIDLLIVLNKTKNKINDAVRLNRLLSPLRLSVDLVVVDSETYNYWSDTPGNVYYEAHSSGKVLYEAA